MRRREISARRRPAGQLALFLILGGLVACAPTPQPEPTDASPALATRVAGTLEVLTAQSPTDSPVPPTTTPSPTSTPTGVPASPTPPSGGVSLNCDGTYQRTRLEPGPAGRTLYVDQWREGRWRQAWSYNAGDPQVRQVTERAGAYQFGECRRLIVVPILYRGSGAVLELHVFAWQDGDVREVYTDDGIQGAWEKDGERLVFREAVYLYDEPNCCPCNRRISVHVWDGTRFTRASQEDRPTYTGTPPAYCTP